MILEIHRPSYPLNRYIEHFAFYEGYCPDYPRERILPDGHVELFIALDEITRRFYRSLKQQDSISCKSAWVSGMQQAYFYADADQNSSMFAIKFKPGGSYPFLQIPASELNDLFVDADTVLGPDVLVLRARLYDAASPDEMFLATETFLMSRLQQVEHHASFDVIEALVSKMAGMADVSIRHIAQELGYSQKQLGQICKKHIGLTPKHFHRLTRFNQALQQIHAASALKWSAASLNFGYYDQAHFINEFKFFSGMTPGEYRHQRGAFSGFIPIFSER